ncbi:MAG: hypothetical protein GWO00_15450, partial [Gemmatimonadetes bacterium]|nr:hypothetical protein [Gemmatimonadota bacterium]NIU32225.1 hypothetical protein [Gemmatimonadota bacterium]NIW65324.1 hypothetical protein [Gemmatimonadota bacterium]NIX40653.1 hypothetical protein [Gemmatimonadota bacterium]
ALEEGGRIRTAKEAGKRAVLANALRDRMPFSEVAGDLVHVMTSEKNRAENKRRYRAAAAAAHPGELLFGLSRLQRQARLLPAPR